jgi:lipoic acid synthetase
LEALVPDFGGSAVALATVAAAAPDVLGHNLETVACLYATVRPRADYARSLAVLRRAREAGRLTKTGIMVGLGETPADVLALMRDARQAGCDIFTAGQYLRPTRRHLPVRRYVEPAEFEMYRSEGLRMGFGVVVSGPLVRSSTYSEEQQRYLRARGGN